MALIRNERLFKTGRSGRMREGWESEELWRVRKSEKVGFEAFKKLNAGEIKCS